MKKTGGSRVFRKPLLKGRGALNCDAGETHPQKGNIKARYFFLHSQTLKLVNILSSTCLRSASGLCAYLRASSWSGAALGEGAAHLLTGPGGDRRPPGAEAPRGFAKLPGRGAAGGGSQLPERAVRQCRRGCAAAPFLRHASNRTRRGQQLACSPGWGGRVAAPGVPPRPARGCRCAPLKTIYSYKADVFDFAVLNSCTLPLYVCVYIYIFKTAVMVWGLKNRYEGSGKSGMCKEEGREAEPDCPYVKDTAKTKGIKHFPWTLYTE